MPKITRQPVAAEPAAKHHYVTGAPKGLAAIDQSKDESGLQQAAAQQYGGNTLRTGMKAKSVRKV